MSKTQYFGLLISILFGFLICSPGQSDESQGPKLKAVPFADVVIADKFWAPQIKTNHKVTIPHCFKQCEETGRISNFEKAAGLLEGKFEGKYFNDSDVYKVIEGAAYSLKSHPDPELEKYVDRVIDKIAAAQWQDGYLYNFYSMPQHQSEKRWTNTRVMHELYCAGHFFEAAVAYHEATGKSKILDIAVRLADYIDSVFGPDKKRDIPGHEEIEIGLVKLYRATGGEKYLKLAKFFLDERGRAHARELYGTYCQDHKPVVEQDAAVGHAVRAGYLYCGMADVAALTGDKDYIKALDRIWQDVVSKKLYLTGGIGATGKGEAFGDDYYLPNATAYCETCAAIANALWNHRMFLLHGDAKYIDILERVLYNGFLSGVSLQGNEFFYRNPLASEGNYQRSPWFGCACCPSNVVRFVPSIGRYVYAIQGDNIYVNLFVAGSSNLKLPKPENTVKLRQLTNYPWDGQIRVTIEPQQPAEFAICLRIPAWAQNQPAPSDLYRYMNADDEKVSLKVNGKPLEPDMEKGFARIRRKWDKGNIIELGLPMPVRQVLCNEKVAANTGKVALQRGPIVYCAEGIDNGGQVRHIVLTDDAELKAQYRKDLLGGVAVIGGKTLGVQQSADGKSLIKDKVDFVAIPYYAWAHRGPGEMAVWLPRTAQAAKVGQSSGSTKSTN